ncbi:MAG: AAA family ATPase [Synergistaceae bacterium]|nr:AAA family ATPase [Synergistaceae bacterium]
MLEKLLIHNIGGLREAELEFTPGLNIITGESGAGKSSVIKALELLTGSRGGAKFIRAGEERGQVEARFTGSIITREILNTGRSKSKLGSINIGLNECSKIVNELIRIQNQFAQIELLDSDRQLAMLDSCIDDHTIFEEFHEAFERAKTSSGELQAMKKRRAEIEKQYSNAKEIFDLVKTAKPEPGLEIRLENLLSDITHRTSERKRAKTSLDSLTGGLSEHGLIENAKTCFENLYAFMNEDDISQVRDSLENIDNVMRNISIDDEEGGLALREETESRLGALRKLKRMSNILDENELLNYCDEISNALEWLEKSYSELENLSARSLDDRKEAQALAMRIRESRQHEADMLAQRVNNILCELAMPGIKFIIKLNSLQKLNHNGADEIEFILQDSTRLGKIENIASGGELSRLLLALQLSLPDDLLPPTIIFDEAAAGLGGRAATLTGLQLKKLSRKCQVILVTHEASIAALGDSHILIQRSESETFMKNISGNERVREIARMLSGSPDLNEALEHARILLKLPPE